MALVTEHLNLIFTVVAALSFLLALFWPRESDGHPKSFALARIIALCVVLPSMALAISYTRSFQQEKLQEDKKQAEQVRDLAQQLSNTTHDVNTLSAQVSGLQESASSSKKECSERTRKLCDALRDATETVAKYQELKDGTISLQIQESSVKFEKNKSDLSDDGKNRLSKLAGIFSWPLALGTIESIKVVGHTDNDGSYEYNHGLSLDRANAVKVFLEKSGVPPRDIDLGR